MQISRSEQKRRIRDFERLVTELTALPARVLEQAPCGEDIRRELLAVERLKGSVRQRQVKYLTKLLIREDLLEAMYAFASHYKGKDLTAKSRQRSLEQWRNALIDEALARETAWKEDKEVDWGEGWRSRIAGEIALKLPKVDARNLSRLSHRFVETRDPRYSREIFRYLHSVQELQRREIHRGETAKTADEDEELN